MSDLIPLRQLGARLEYDEAPSHEGCTSESDIERSYIGGSSIGHKCLHAIALRLRGYPSDRIRPGLRRIFDMGYYVEDVATKEMHKIISIAMPELKLTETGDVMSEQQELKYYGNVCRTHSDGVLVSNVTGQSYLLEVKSANDDSFKSTKRLGLKYAHEEYYDQMQFMMGLGKMSHGLMVMMNKNTCEYYTEIIEFDEITFHYLCAKAEYVAKETCDRFSKSPINFVCNTCNYKETCHGETRVDINCRTCRHCMYAEITDEPEMFARCKNKNSAIKYVKNETDHKQKVLIATICPYFNDYREGVD